MQLNDIKPKREKYQEFYGRNIEQMELLIKDKRKPMTVKQIIERRLNSKQNNWRENYFDTCDAIVRYKDNIKVILNCNLLKKITKKTELTNGGIKTTEKEYQKLKGKEFSISKLELNGWLTKEKALKHPIWRYLLGNLHKDYVELVFRNREKNNLMGVFINNEQLILRLWYVSRLDARSNAGGWSILGVDDGRLVGVAPEAQ